MNSYERSIVEAALNVIGLWELCGSDKVMGESIHRLKLAVANVPDKKENVYPRQKRKSVSND